MNASTLSSLGVHCPSCGHQTIVEAKPGVYRCLKCDFKKDLSEDPKPKEGGVVEVFIGAVGFLLVMALFL